MDNNGRKKIIYLDACLADIEAAQFNEQLEKIYNNQQLFGFFAFHDGNFPYSYRYIDKAEYCRNHGFTWQQMLTELQYLHNEITAMRETAAALLEELKQYDEEAFDNGELVLKNKEDEPLQKKYIVLNECLKDWKEAGSDPELIKIYRNDNIFAGFIYEPFSDTGTNCIMLANQYRNQGISLYDLLHNLSVFIAEQERQNKPVQNQIIEMPEAKEQSQQKSQKREIKNSTVITVAISLLIFILFFAYCSYSSSYGKAKQELIDQKYSYAMTEYQKAYEAEQNKTESDISVSVKNTLVSNNSVGNEWYIENYANNEFIFSTDGLITPDGEKLNTFHLKFGNPITVETYIAEDDKWPDTAKNKYKHTFSKAELINGCYISQTTYVQENNGRYKGNAALWETRYEFKAIMNYPEKPKREDITVTKEEVRERMRNNV